MTAPSDFDQTCPCCGTPVRVVGSVTKFYVSAYEDLRYRYAELNKDGAGLLEEARRLRNENARLTKALALAKEALERAQSVGEIKFRSNVFAAQVADQIAGTLADIAAAEKGEA